MLVLRTEIYIPVPLRCQIQDFKPSGRLLFISKKHALGRCHSARSLRTRWPKLLLRNVRAKEKPQQAELDKTNHLIKKHKLLHRRRR